MSTGAVGSLDVVDGDLEGGDWEVRSAVEWAQVRAMAADGVAQREIARRLRINRRTVKRLAEAGEPPSYSRAPAGSMLDPLEPVICRLKPKLRGSATASLNSIASGRGGWLSTGRWSTAMTD